MRFRFYLLVALLACLPPSHLLSASFGRLLYYLLGIPSLLVWPSTNHTCALLGSLFVYLPDAFDRTICQCQVFCNSLDSKFQSFYVFGKIIVIWIRTLPGAWLFVLIVFADAHFSFFRPPFLALHSSRFRSFNFDWYLINACIFSFLIFLQPPLARKSNLPMSILSSLNMYRGYKEVRKLNFLLLAARDKM